MRIVPERLDYLRFLGLGLDDEIPDHSVLSKARARWGHAVFEKLFVRTVEGCVAARLVDGRKLHLDGSLVEADAARDSVVSSSPELIDARRRAYGAQEAKLPSNRSAPLHEPLNRRLVSTTDPDAPIVRQSKIGGNGDSRPRYQHHHAVDDQCGVIPAAVTIPSDVDEPSQTVPLLEQNAANTALRADTVVADHQYGTHANDRTLQQRGVRPHMGPLFGQNRTCYDGIFSREKFRYDPAENVCLLLGTETSSQLHNWLGVREHDYVIGEFIWTGIDYLGEARAFPRRGSSSGFLDLAGGKKPGFYQRTAYWRDDPVLQLVVLTGEKPERPTRPAPALIKWNWPAGALLTVRAATNCDEVELFLNDRSLGRHAVSPDLDASEWPVPYAPGVLSAIGYRAGKKVAAHELRTAGAPARLQITSLPLPIPSDLALYEITIVDDAGVTVADATPAVTVQVAGAGQLIGLDTGDLDYGGLFKSDTRSAYHGRLLATVRRTAPAGELRLTAATPGLPTSALVSPTNATGVK